MVSCEQFYEVAVIGAGASGVSTVSVLLQNNVNGILWIDPHFNGGRLEKFSNVPSNTKVDLFIKYGQYNTCQQGNQLKSVDRLLEMKVKDGAGGDRGCKLGYAADMVRELAELLRKKVDWQQSTCLSIKETDNGLLSVLLANDFMFSAKKVILATGRQPKTLQLPYFGGEYLDPENYVNSLPEYPEICPTDQIAVIGNSHTAILIMMNLSRCVGTPQKIVNFHRGALRFAEYLSDGRIKFDNTGLKGVVGEWAKEVIIGGGDGRIERVSLDQHCEDEIYAKYLPQCNKVIVAIGYERSKEQMPKIYNKQGEELMVEGHYSDSGKLKFTNNNANEGHLQVYGMGIAFPEKVLDPSGELECSVGLWKFTATAKRRFMK